MGETLDRGDERQRQGPGGQDIERAVLVVVVEDAVGGQKRGQQERDPQHAGCDAREQVEIGAKTERGDGDHHEIKTESGADGATLAEGEGDVAPKQGEGGSHRARFFPRTSLCANLVLSAVWLATTAMPPCAR